MAEREQISRASTRHASANPTRPLNHEERVRIINKPFPQIRVFSRSYLWAGTLIERDPLSLSSTTKGRTRAKSRSTYDDAFTITIDELVALSEGQ